MNLPKKDDELFASTNFPLKSGTSKHVTTIFSSQETEIFIMSYFLPWTQHWKVKLKKHGIIYFHLKNIPKYLSHFTTSQAKIIIVEKRVIETQGVKLLRLTLVLYRKGRDIHSTPNFLISENTVIGNNFSRSETWYRVNQKKITPVNEQEIQLGQIHTKTDLTFPLKKSFETYAPTRILQGNDFFIK